MSVTIKDVEHVAKLARLEFNEPEKEKLTHELNEILKYWLFHLVCLLIFLERLPLLLLLVQES